MISRGSGFCSCFITAPFFTNITGDFRILPNFAQFWQTFNSVPSIRAFTNLPSAPHTSQLGIFSSLIVNYYYGFMLKKAALGFEPRVFGIRLSLAMKRLIIPLQPNALAVWRRRLLYDYEP